MPQEKLAGGSLSVRYECAAWDHENNLGLKVSYYIE